MSHLLILVVTPFLGLFLWEHLGSATSRPSTYLTAAATRLATFAAWLGTLWARLSNFITWLQLYEIGQILTRLLSSIANLVVGPVTAAYRAYWNYVHASQYPRLVAAGSVLLFIAFEAVMFVWFLLPKFSLLPTDKQQEDFSPLLILMGLVLPAVFTAIHFIETHPKNNIPQPPRPDTPRPHCLFDRS